MKILSIANERIPSEKANSINIVKMASALAELGQDVTLVLPKRKNPVQKDLFSYYEVPQNFSLHTLPVPDTLNLGKYGFLWSQFIFSVKIFFNKNWDKKEYIVFTRDIYTSLFLAWRGYTVFHDLHGFPENSQWFWKYVLKKMKGIICTNEWKMKQVATVFGIATKKMIVAPNGFDERVFEKIKSYSQLQLKQKHGFSPEQSLVLYSGHFYDWKGAHVLAEAAAFLPNVQVVIMGGSESEVQTFTKKYALCHNITILGHKPFTEVPEYLGAADVLVLPNSRKTSDPRLAKYSEYDTSPIKMFEYMASGRPIVASNLPSLREILDEKTAVFFEADNPKNLSEKILQLLSDAEQRKNLSQNALEKVQAYSWKKRAEKIIQFLSV